MTTQQDFERMSRRIVSEALADVRREADERVIADRLRRVCDDAVEAMWWTRIRLRALRG